MTEMLNNDSLTSFWGPSISYVWKNVWNLTLPLRLVHKRTLLKILFPWAYILITSRNPLAFPLNFPWFLLILCLPMKWWKLLMDLPNVIVLLVEKSITVIPLHYVWKEKSSEAKLVLKCLCILMMGFFPNIKISWCLSIKTFNKSR